MRASAVELLPYVYCIFKWQKSHMSDFVFLSLPFKSAIWLMRGVCACVGMRAAHPSARAHTRPEHHVVCGSGESLLPEGVLRLESLLAVVSPLPRASQDSQQVVGLSAAGRGSLPAERRSRRPRRFRLRRQPMYTEQSAFFEL